MRIRGMALSIALLGALLLAACGQAGAGATAVPAATTAPAPQSEATAPAAEAAAGAIRVGSKNFTEMYIMGELYAQLLEANGFTVERTFDLGATPVAHGAITQGDIDLYPEYTSTGLLEVLQQEPITDATQLMDTLRREYEGQFQLTWLEPSAFNNTNTFAVTQETAEARGLATYSDLFAQASELRLGGPPEFPERNDTANLEQVYGTTIDSFAEYSQLGTGALRYDALQSGDVDVIVAFGTDGRIRADELVILQDDKQAYPVYNVAPVVRQEVLEQYPQLPEILNQLAPLLTDSAMQDLNYQVDGPDAREPADVAREFLAAQGLVQ
jgi:osmoprotectant transport system substrate-binding protein